MHTARSIQLRDVQAVYGGPEFDLWELVMGQQIHVGGLRSSQRLADKAAIREGTTGVDLCCCTGAGMRFLVRFRGVHRMHGVDATPEVVERGRARCRIEGLAEQIEFTLADACHCGLPDAMADFVWGEDAWCYVVDKGSLVAEAARLVKPGGTIAWTDWVEGPARLSPTEAQRFLQFMKFPNIYNLDDYAAALARNGCDVLVCEDTGQFAPCVDLYLNMLEMQVRYDALRIVGFDTNMFEAIVKEMAFTGEMARLGKIAQGRFVAAKRA